MTTEPKLVNGWSREGWKAAKEALLSLDIAQIEQPKGKVADRLAYLYDELRKLMEPGKWTQ